MQYNGSWTANAFEEVLELRNNYDEIREEACVLANTWGVEATFIEKRQRIVKKFFDKLSSDYKFKSVEDKFKTLVYYGIMDIILSQLKVWTFSFKNIVSLFKVLESSYLKSASDQDLHKGAVVSRNMYQNDLTEDFSNRLLSLRSAFPSNLNDI